MAQKLKLNGKTFSKVKKNNFSIKRLYFMKRYSKN
jgi:hypothetical protein